MEKKYLSVSLILNILFIVAISLSSWAEALSFYTGGLVGLLIAILDILIPIGLVFGLILLLQKLPQKKVVVYGLLVNLVGFGILILSIILLGLGMHYPR